MKVLIVCSRNSGRVVPFITEQAAALVKIGLSIEYFYVERKGLKGYLKSYRLLHKRIKKDKPDLLHAHYGLAGLLANLQRSIPVVTTYHGSDINIPWVLMLSRVAMILSKWSVFVSEQQLKRAGIKKRYSIIPCGVDLELFQPSDKDNAREQLQLDKDKNYVLFAGAFHNKVKNAILAKDAISTIPSVALLELNGYTREQVVLLMNAVDTVLMTSYTEGSPQFIKEAMACNCPVVSVPVGDVKLLIDNVNGCYISTYLPDSIANYICKVIDSGERTNGRQRILQLELDAETVARKIIEVYKHVLKN